MKDITLPKIKEGLYKIDEYGNVWSEYSQKFLTPKKDKNGYLCLSLSGGSRGQTKSVRVATLVALFYIGNPSKNIKDPTINHIDSNILNNHYSNLEWVERGVNSSIRKNKGQGSLNHEAILKEAEVKEICKLIMSTSLSFAKIGEKFNVSKFTINNIVQKKNWKEVTQEYENLKKYRVITRDKSGRYVQFNPFI